MILFAAITEGLLRMTDNDAMFRFVDYWLFYVILMGTLHGAPFGTMAGMIACIGYAASWRESGRDLYLLLYNMDNWLPLLMYLLSGGLFGFLHDRTAETMTAIQIEKEQRVEETEFIETMLKRVDADRNSLQEQVVRYRDSYGRIYAITQELDTLQPEQVFLSTLGILEDVMQNKSVALYSCSSSSSFARMVVHSRELINLPKSIDMDKMPQMRESINRGEMFANKQLIPGYPTFCTPIMQNDHPIAVITLWEVPFEQQTLYHQNLLNVVSGWFNQP
jgi:UDP-glucose 4-epimerase